MSMEHIRSSIEAATRYLSEHPDEARYTDSAATAHLEDGLGFRVRGPGGEELTTDMPPAVGGAGAAPSPGWVFRAALASCVGSLVVMEAARDAVAMTDLEVVVDSESDDRGILGMNAAAPAGPLRMRIVVRATDVDPATLRRIVDRATERCPVSDAARRVIETEVEIDPAS